MASAEVLLKKFQKDMGDAIGQKGVVVKNISRIPTGIFPLDLALGGGIPRGRLTIVYGNESSCKTALAYLVMAQVQREGLKAVYLDIECSFDPTWAIQFGLDMKELIVISPQYAEQAVDIVEGFLYADDVGIVVLDSIAAMTTDNEVASSAEKMNVGGNSYVVGKMIRKAVVALSNAAKNDRFPALFCINQIRHKIGCFDCNSPVWLADGTTMKMGALVKQKFNGDVLSMADDGTLVPRKVIGWANNGIDDGWLEITVAGSNRGTRTLRVTNGHSIFTPSGEVLAGSLKVGDLVTTEGMQYYSSEQHEVILGSMLGDGSLRFSKGNSRGHLRVGHGYKQRDYAEYKASVFGSILGEHSNNVEFWTKSSLEFSQYKDIKKSKGLTHVPQHMVEKLTPRALAIWYLDDGNYGGSHAKWGKGKPSISAATLDTDSLNRLAAKISSLGAGTPVVKENGGLRWLCDEVDAFFTVIAPYVPLSMSYKVKDTFVCGTHLNVATIPPFRKTYAEPILAIKELSGKRKKYDITVEGNHNYLVNGVVVHNTMFGNPETMPGGNSLRFASSLTLKLYGKDEIVKEINPAVPTFKVITGQVQKAKMPILSKAFEYSLTMLPHGTLSVGQAPTWNFVATYCKNAGTMTQAGQGKPWKLLTMEGTTQKQLKSIYETDNVFRQAVHKSIIDRETSKGTLAEVEESIDPDTGEITSVGVAA